MDKETREPGFYWVRHWATGTNQWTIAQYLGDYDEWNLIDGETYKTPSFEEIGPRVERHPTGAFVPYQLCPKCNGQKTVSFPPYAPGDAPSALGTEIAYTCGICNGAGIIPQFALPAAPGTQAPHN